MNIDCNQSCALGFLVTMPLKSLPGTYFGTLAEFEALKFEERLSQHVTAFSSTVDIVMGGWVGAIVHYAETAALKLLGDLVSVPCNVFGIAIR